MNASIIKQFANKSFKKEGEDHIRISPFAETNLGKLLSPDWRKKFFIPHVGEFLSPNCFANWIVTGDDEARHNPAFRAPVAVKGYRNFVLYAKFYQLCSMRAILEKEQKDLPFAMYKVHTSGVKEFDRWKEYPSEVKEMLAHVVDPARGPKVPYDWEGKFPNLLEKINSMIEKIANGGNAAKDDTKDANGNVAEEELSDEELDKLAAEKLNKQ